MKKLLFLFLAAASLASAQNVSLQKKPSTDPTAPNALTAPSAVIVVPSGGSISATGSGTIIATSAPAPTSVAWNIITGTPTTVSGYGITDAVSTSRTISTTVPLTGGGDLSANRTIAIPAAGSGINGYLTAADWAAFTAKEAALTFTAPLSRTINAVSIPAATGSVNGYLSSADWTAFNGKQNALTIGNVTEATSSVLTINGGTGAVIGSGTTIQVKQAATAQSGYLSSTDWNTFNGKQASGSYIAALTGDATAAGPGSAALTLATVNANVGTFGNTTTIPVVTVNGKGLVTAVTTATVSGLPSQTGHSGQFLTTDATTANWVAITSTTVGLGSVTNDAQTKAAVVPNTAPSAGQVLVGNVGGTAYAPVSLSGGVTITSAGVATLANADVIAKVLTGYTSGAGTVSASDSILQAIQKLNGNDALALPLAGGTMSGAITFGSSGGNITGSSGAVTITSAGTNQPINAFLVGTAPLRVGASGDTYSTTGAITIGAGTTTAKGLFFGSEAANVIYRTGTANLRTGAAWVFDSSVDAVTNFVRAGQLIVSDGTSATRARMTSPGDGIITFQNVASNGFSKLNFGGTTDYIGHSTSQFDFATNSVVAMTIDSSQNTTFFKTALDSQTLATTSTDGFVATNPTAALSGSTVQMSPRSRWTGSAWNSSGTPAAETNSFIAENLPATNAGTTTATWRLRYANSAVSAGAYSDVFAVSSAGTATATLFSGSGASLTTLNASNLSSGTVPDARFPATLPALNGSALTALNATNLSSGTVGTARLGSGTADSTTYLRGDNTWQVVSVPTAANPTATIGATAVNGSASTFMRSDAAPALPSTLPALNGSALTALNASNLASGTVATARLGSGTANNSSSLMGDSTWKVLPPVNNAGSLLYSKSYWSSLSDFTVTGSTPSLVAGAIRLSGSTNTFDAQALTLNSIITSDDSVDVEVLVQVVSISGSSHGVAIGRKSVNTWAQGNISAGYDTSTTINTMSVWPLATGSPTGAIATANAANGSVVAGDMIRMVFSQRRATVTLTVNNLSQHTFNYIRKTSDTLEANAGQFVIFGMGGTFDIQSVKVFTRQPTTPNVLFVGDSKTVWANSGVGSPAVLSIGDMRFASLLQALGPVAVIAGGADRTVEIIQEVSYMLALKPKYIVLNIGRNDLQSGVATATWQANYQSIVASFVAAGATVIHLMPIPETVQDQSTLTSFINATYPSGLKVDVSGSWSNGTDLSADGVHPNYAGQRLIAKAILDAAYITPISGTPVVFDTPYELAPETNFPQQTSGLTYNGTDVANTGNITTSLGFITDTIGATLKVKSGTNAKSGTFTLSSGTVTVANTSLTANSVVMPTLKTASGTRAGLPDIVATPGTGFTATAVSTDNSTYNFVIVEVN